MKTSSKVVALGGILAAAAIALMLFGSIIPFSTFSVPALASFCVIFMLIELGTPAAFLCYVAISVISMLIVADKEIALLFVCFFGYYPILKAFFEKKLKKPLAIIAKLLVFNVSMCGLYYVITHVFIIESVLTEFEAYTKYFILLLLALGNVLLIVFDFALTRIISLYLFKLRDRLIKSH